MSSKPNFLFIMADQLRADYLGCAGHPSLKTPNIDALAAAGVSFANTHVQGPVCGSSRMSFYTGRYVMSHGATYNNVPLRAGEPTLGDHLRPLGYRVGLVGKTHFRPDLEGFKRLGVDLNSKEGRLAREGGFEAFVRDDGLHPDKTVSPELQYNNWLRGLGYEGENPWHTYANSAEDPEGNIVSGWYMRNARLAARVEEEHSETAFMTNRAMDFIQSAEGTPWCLHLSYIKPHWPYMAPEPYHNMYGPEDIIPVNCSDEEKINAHPVVAAFRQHEESVNFSKEETRHAVIPTYMGLISQLDKHLGRLFDFLKQKGLWGNTVIIFTSDHGDYLGDHWLGEKDLFHESVQRIPLIIRNPLAPQRHGNVEPSLVEAIDIVPTLVDLAGGENTEHILEGRSLAPLLEKSQPVNWREAVFSESDYAWRKARQLLLVHPDKAQAKMIRSQDWKLILYRGFDCELYDLVDDPQERHNRANDPGCKQIISDMMGLYFDWLESRCNRITMSNPEVETRTNSARRRGYIFGAW